MLLSLVVLACLVYSNTLEVPFYFDDCSNIERNPHIRLTKLTFKGVTEAGFKSLASNRPIANISFALNYYFDQYNVTGYHVINIIIHVTTGLLLYFFLKTTLSLPSHRSKYNHHSSIAFFAALIWLVHPIQTQSVTYIVQRMNSMAAMFYILSFLLYVKGRLVKDNKKSLLLFAACAFSGIIGSGCKEIVATLPLFIFLYEWYFFQDLSKAWLKHHLMYVVGILILFGLLAFVYMRSNPLEAILSSYALLDFTLTERVLTQFRVVIYYISLLVYPHPSRLVLLHDFKISHSLIDPITTLLSIGAIISVVGLAFYIAKKERLISFCIIWFFGNLMMESSVIGLGTIYEHRTYLPSMFFFLPIIILAYRHVKRDLLKAGVLSSTILLLCVWTYERNSIWSEPIAFWNDVIRKNSHSAWAYNNLAESYIRKKAYSLALTNLKEAIRLNPNLAEAYNNLGLVYLNSNDTDAALRNFEMTLLINPKNSNAYNNMGMAFCLKKSYTRGISLFKKAIHFKPSHLDANFNLARAYELTGQYHEAVEQYQISVYLNPYDICAYHNAGLIYMNHLKDKKKAVSLFKKALSIDPDFWESEDIKKIIDEFKSGRSTK